jgi:ubiquinone/menaquinone biosynthesis C-methylase UbiE
MLRQGALIWRHLVRFGFHLLYNQFAFTYDSVSKFVSLGAWRCWQRSALRHIPPPDSGIVLEIAHGTGDLQLDLSAGGWRAVGLDLSASMGKIASAKLRSAAVLCRLVRGRSQQLPFADGAFAAVISTFPSEFISAPETLREVNRVLKDGGVFVIVPGARFTNGGAARAGVEALYRITGQSVDGLHALDARLRAEFARFGFDAQIAEEVCPRSAASVVIAHKRTGQGAQGVL